MLTENKYFFWREMGGGFFDTVEERPIKIILRALVIYWLVDLERPFRPLVDPVLLALRFSIVRTLRALHKIAIACSEGISVRGHAITCGSIFRRFWAPNTRTSKLRLTTGERCGGSAKFILQIGHTETYSQMLLACCCSTFHAFASTALCSFVCCFFFLLGFH